MATTFSIENAPASGVFVDLTAYLFQDSVTLKLNTIDFALLNPPAQTWISPAGVGVGVRMTDPYWLGNVAAVMTSDLDLRDGNVVYTITATNTNPLPNDTAPFDLSDVPVAATAGDYLLEDASGHYLLEDGTDWAPGALLLEQPYSKGYQTLSVQTYVNSAVGSPNQTLGRATSIFTPGLRPGNNFKLTSSNQGYTSAPFQLTQVTVRWPELATQPVFDVEFGNAPPTLGAWVLGVPPIAPGPPPVGPPPIPLPASTVAYGLGNATQNVTYAMGGGIVSIVSNTFTTPRAATCQVVGSIRAQMLAWDNFIATPRRAVRATLSGGIYTGSWQELPFGLDIVTIDVSSASGLALAAGTYTVTLDIDTQEFNQMKVLSGYVEVLVTS